MEQEYLKKSKTRAIIALVGCIATIVLFYCMAAMLNVIVLSFPVMPVVVGVYLGIKIANYKGKDKSTALIQDILIVMAAVYAFESLFTTVDYLSRGVKFIGIIYSLITLTYNAVFTAYLYSIFYKQEIIGRKIYLIASIAAIAISLSSGVYNFSSLFYAVAIIPYFFKYDDKVEKFAYGNDMKPVATKVEPENKAQRNYTTLGDLKSAKGKAVKMDNDMKKILIMAGIALLVAIIL